MPESYRHRQHNPFLAAVLGVILLVTMGTLFTVPPRQDPGFMVVPVMVAIVFCAAIGLFTRLTTEVNDQHVRWYFGYGLPSGKFDLVKIARVEKTKTNLLEGWGLHWTIWHGWLWNVGGFQAVQLFGTDGSSVTIGTDDPQGLIEAIRHRVSEGERRHSGSDRRQASGDRRGPSTSSG